MRILQNTQPDPFGGRRVLFLGDSITQHGHYVSFLEYYLSRLYPAVRFDMISAGLSSETLSGLSEAAHPFPRPCLHSRLPDVLAGVRPDVVFACYGMNDGIYQPQSRQRMQAFQNGVLSLIAANKNAGAGTVLLTPPPYNPPPAPADAVPEDAAEYSFRNPFAGYDAVLADYAQWELSLPPADVQVIDLHGAMGDYLARQQKAAPGCRLSDDGIHPNMAGHLLMAAQILSAIGVPMPPVNLENVSRIADDPLWALVAERRRLRASGWLPFLGYTREAVVKSHSIGATEEAAAVLQARIDIMRLQNRPAFKKEPKNDV